MDLTGLRYVTDVGELEPGMLLGGFFEGWQAAPSPQEHLALLRNSTHIAAAVIGQQLVGFATALTDGVLCAYIPLLEVLPEYRRAGVGAELVRLLLTEVGPLYMIDVMCDEDVFAFYELLGFARTAGGAIRNYGWKTQSIAT